MQNWKRPSAALLTCCLILAYGARVRAALPPNFVDEGVVTSGTGGPTDIAFTPDGRMLVTRQSGTLRVYSLAATPAPLLATALTFPAVVTVGSPPPICSNSERGLLGVAVDPSFAANHFIYLFYTYNKFNTSPCPSGLPTNATNPVNRVSRFTLPDTNVIDPATEVVQMDNLRSPNGNHNGGDLAFGKDGYLYISSGDGGADYNGDSGAGGSNNAARDQFQAFAKILRIGVNADGSTFIPASNPFQDMNTERCNLAGETDAANKCQETYAWGLRNPFRFAMDPNDAGTRFFINDVGQGAWEEIDLGQSGVDYGWSCREGAHTNQNTGPCNPTPPGMVDPIFEYQHGVSVPGTTSPTSCNAITGAAFVPNGVWPGYDGRYLFTDYGCGWIFMMSGTGPYNAADFATNLGTNSAVSLTFGPRGDGQALYYTTYAGGGQIRRIAYGTAKGDISGDGRPELVLRNTTDNQHRIWVMNGVDRTSDVALPAAPSADWQVVGADDFNNNGVSDLVYYNTVTGAVQFQFMNGTIPAGAPVALTGASPLAPDWKLAATGDFSRDGRPDLVWRNQTTQLLDIWTMNGTAKIGNIAPSPDHAVDNNWIVVAALDYDFDGNRDLLWYNVSSGRTVQWLMNASVVRTVGRFTNPMAAGDNNWKVVAGGDYGVGAGGIATSNDMVWRNDTSGRYVVWHLDYAGNRTSGVFTNPMSPATNPTDWNVVGPR